MAAGWATFHHGHFPVKTAKMERKIVPKLDFRSTTVISLPPMSGTNCIPETLEVCHDGVMEASWGVSEALEDYTPTRRTAGAVSGTVARIPTSCPHDTTTT